MYFSRFSTVFAKSLFFPGAIGFFIYSWIAGLVFPTWGVWFGTVAAYAGTFVSYWLYLVLFGSRIYVTEELVLKKNVK